MIRFLTIRIILAEEIHGQISDVYALHVMSERKMCNRERAFKEVWENVLDNPQSSGWPSLITEDLVNAVEKKGSWRPTILSVNFKIRILLWVEQICSKSSLKIYHFVVHDMVKEAIIFLFFSAHPLSFLLSFILLGGRLIYYMGWKMLTQCYNKCLN